MTATSNSDLVIPAHKPSMYCIILLNFSKEFHDSAKLQRHLHTKHIHCKEKLLTFLKYKCGELNHSQHNLTSVIKCENVHVQSILQTSCYAIKSSVFGDNHLKFITTISLSNSTVSR
jgi:hypothetical protein